MTQPSKPMRIAIRFWTTAVSSSRVSPSLRRSLTGALRDPVWLSPLPEISRVVGVSPPSPVVGIFPVWKAAFSVMVSPPTFGKNPHWDFVLEGVSRAARAAAPSILNCLKSTPLIRPVAGVSFCWLVCQAKIVGPSPFRITRPTAFGNFQKAQRFCFPNGGGNRVTINTVALEILIRYRQPAVVITAMMPKFNFEAIKNTPCR